MPEFSSPINTGLSAGPVGIDNDALNDELTKIYGAIRILTQKFGTYNGLETLDPTRYIAQLNPPFGESIQVQRMQPALVKANVTLTAGQLVFLRLTGGELVLEKADAASGTARRAHGWVPNAIASGDKGIVFLGSGWNGGFGGLTIAATYYLSASTPGGITTTAPSASGTLKQEVGTALSATDLYLFISVPIVNP